MAKFYLSNKAVDDLSEIWSYTVHKWSEKQADKYYMMLIECCEELLENPKLGKNYFEIGSGMLGYREGLHIIFYRVISKTEIEVVRILHSSMDLKRKIYE